MDKHQLRQSAVADFMQSLEQLNELWEGETEAIWDDGSQNSGTDRPESRSVPTPRERQNPQSQGAQSEVNPQQPRR